MDEFEGNQDSPIEGRLRTSLALIAPPATSIGVLHEVQRRVARRRRRVREVIGGALVVLVSGGTAAGLALSASPQMTAVPLAHATVAPSTTAPARLPSAYSRHAADSVGSAQANLNGPPPMPPPCPTDLNTPTMASGSFCGPVPGPGYGLGPNGTCTGSETDAPCGSGVVPGRFYAYTMPGTCSGLVTFDGKQWVSELPPPNPVPAFDVWIQLSGDGSVRWIAPTGSVGLKPYAGQPPAECRG
jgi:hypothetical protein